MDRRCFISRVGQISAASGTLLPLIGCGGDKNRQPGDVDIEIPATLPAALAHLVDPEYQPYASESSQTGLYQTLLDKGVLSTAGTLDNQAVHAAAQTDSIVEYGGFYHTETELQLYGLAYSLVLMPPAV